MADAQVAPKPTGSRVLWVEGKDDDAVVQSLCERHRVPHRFTVLEKGGVDPLLTRIALEIRAPGLDRFGIVVDANGDAAARLAHIRRAIEPHGYPHFPTALEDAGIVVTGAGVLPRVGVWIMPDNGSPGALEDFTASLIPEGDPLWVHARDSVDAIPRGERRFPDVRRSKA